MWVWAMWERETRDYELQQHSPKLTFSFHLSERNNSDTSSLSQEITSAVTKSSFYGFHQSDISNVTSFFFSEVVHFFQLYLLCFAFTNTISCVCLTVTLTNQQCQKSSCHMKYNFKFLHPNKPLEYQRM